MGTSDVAKTLLLVRLLHSITINDRTSSVRMTLGIARYHHQTPGSGTFGALCKAHCIIFCSRRTSHVFSSFPFLDVGSSCLTRPPGNAQCIFRGSLIARLRDTQAERYSRTYRVLSGRSTPGQRNQKAPVQARHEMSSRERAPTSAKSAICAQHFTNAIHLFLESYSFSTTTDADHMCVLYGHTRWSHHLYSRQPRSPRLPPTIGQSAQRYWYRGLSLALFYLSKQGSHSPFPT